MPMFAASGLVVVLRIAHCPINIRSSLSASVRGEPLFCICCRLTSTVSFLAIVLLVKVGGLTQKLLMNRQLLAFAPRINCRHEWIKMNATLVLGVIEPIVTPARCAYLIRSFFSAASLTTFLSRKCVSWFLLHL